jgi:hypothetical protein
LGRRPKDSLYQKPKKKYEIHYTVPSASILLQPLGSEDQSET